MFQVKITGTKQNHLNYWIAGELAAVTNAERKLLLIPLMFIFLRVWDVVDSILFVYLKLKTYDNGHYYWLQLFTVSIYNNKHVYAMLYSIAIVSGSSFLP